MLYTYGISTWCDIPFRLWYIPCRNLPDDYEMCRTRWDFFGNFIGQFKGVLGRSKIWFSPTGVVGCHLKFTAPCVCKAEASDIFLWSTEVA